MLLVDQQRARVTLAQREDRPEPQGEAEGPDAHAHPCDRRHAGHRAAQPRGEPDQKGRNPRLHREHETDHRHDGRQRKGNRAAPIRRPGGAGPRLGPKADLRLNHVEEEDEEAAHAVGRQGNAEHGLKQMGHRPSEGKGTPRLTVKRCKAAI